jgi:hypothetical protein
MTNEEIIRMARETGKTKWFGTHEDGTNDFLGVEFTPEQLKRFTSLVAEATKAKAVKVCEGIGWGNNPYVNPKAGTTCAAAIRSMK